MLHTVLIFKLDYHSVIQLTFQNKKETQDLFLCWFDANSKEFLSTITNHDEFSSKTNLLMIILQVSQEFMGWNPNQEFDPASNSKCLQTFLEIWQGWRLFWVPVVDIYIAESNKIVCSEDFNNSHDYYLNKTGRFGHEFVSRNESRTLQ